LNLWKIIGIVANRSYILRHQIRFRLWPSSGPCWRSLQHPPRSPC